MIPTIDLIPIDAPKKLPSILDHVAVFTGITARAEVLRFMVPQEAEDQVFGYDERSGFARFPKSQTEFAFDAKLCFTGLSTTHEVNLANIKFAFPEVQTFPDGHILLSSARCHKWEDGSFESNAKVYRADGTADAEFCLGDGLEHLAIDLRGRIWAGYTDEGVYGNYGWGFEPIGRSGLVCFDHKGQKLWEYRPPKGFDSISDCYALNSAEDAVWLCPYVDFPIVRIDPDFNITAWHSDLSGPRQIAVRGDRLLVYGGYMEKAHDCWLVQLRDSTAERIAQVQLRLPDGQTLNKATVVGRDRFLHVIVDDRWYRFNVPIG